MKKIVTFFLWWILFLLWSGIVTGQNLTRMATASGTNTYSATFNPAVIVVTQTTIYVVTFTNANSSTTVTLDPDAGDALAAIAIKDNAGNDPAVGTIKAGGTYNLKYNGTHFRVIESISAGTGTVTAVNGTSNRVTSTGGATPVIDISATFEALLGKVAQRIDQNNASTTSAQLATTISDETGTGAVVLASGPTLTNPVVGTQAVSNNSTTAASTEYVDRVVNRKLDKNYDWAVKTSNYTPGVADTLTNRAFSFRSVSAISFTVPPFSTFDFTQGSSFLIYNDSLGTLSILEGSGVDFKTTAAEPWSLEQDEYAVVIKDNSTNSWKLMMGNPTAGDEPNTIHWETKTSNYTPVASDTSFTNPAFRMRSASAISFTVPPFTTTNFAVGTTFLIQNDSTGQLSILEGSGVDFETTATEPWTLEENEYAVVSKVNGTNTWTLMMGNPGGGGDQEETLDAVFASTGNVTTGEDQLFSYTIPGGTLAADGNTIQGRFSGIVANNANVKTIRLKFGSTTIATRTTTTPTIGQGWTIDWECFRTGAATQRCNVTFNGSDGIASAFYTAATETLSGTVAVVLTGDATATDDVIMHTSKTRFVP